MWYSSKYMYIENYWEMDGNFGVIFFVFIFSRNCAYFLRPTGSLGYRKLFCWEMDFIKWLRESVRLTEWFSFRLCIKLRVPVIFAAVYSFSLWWLYMVILSLWWYLKNTNCWADCCQFMVFSDVADVFGCFNAITSCFWWIFWPYF